MSDVITPKDLARELGKSPKTIRDFLRKTYGVLEPPTTRWELRDDQRREVLEHFRAGR